MKRDNRWRYSSFCLSLNIHGKYAFCSLYTILVICNQVENARFVFVEWRGLFHCYCEYIHLFFPLENLSAIFLFLSHFFRDVNIHCYL